MTAAGCIPCRFGDERAQAKEGSSGAGGHGVMLAAAGRPGQVWFWAARQAGAPAEIPSGVAVPPQSPTRALDRRVDKGPSL